MPACSSTRAPGDSLLVIDGAVLDHTAGVPMTIVTADPPPAVTEERGERR